MFLKSKMLVMTGIVLFLMAVSSYAPAATDDSQSATTMQPTLQGDHPQNDSAANPPAPATDESAVTTDSQNANTEKQKSDTGEQPARPADSD